MFMSRVSARHFPLPAALRPLRAMLTAERYPGVQTLWARSTLRQVGDPVLGVEALVVHVARETGTDGALALMQAGRASWHWIIPSPAEPQHGRFVWQAAPEGRAARHLPARLTHPAIAEGRARLNHASLAVLLAADPHSPGAPPSRWQLAALAELVRHLWARYPALTHVICRSEIDPDTAPPALDWDMLRHLATGVPAPDLPPMVARATPLALLDRAGRAEAALRTN
jgi:N-acetylmuramoyl-L-alanine amidase